MRKDTRFRITSTTDLVAQNNKEANVNIVNQYPVLRSTISAGTGTTRDIIQNIDRMDVGIKLKLTPQIIENSEVRMMLSPSIEAVIDPGPQGTQFAPTIARREVSTTVTVPDGRTIVIAGLTREDKTKVTKKFPLLGSLPLVGWLFTSKSDSKEITNLLIVVTPQIVTDAAAAKRAKDRLEIRTGLKVNEQK
jgi:general secretion pathway protein D